MAGVLEEKKAISLRVCMIKKEFHSVDYMELISEGAKVERFALDPEFGVEGALFIKDSFETQPRWIDFVEEAVNESLDGLKSKSCSALLFIRIKEYTLAFIFGYGRFLVDPRCLVNDFGIKTALNSIDHESLRSVDMFSLDEQPVQKRAQASRSTDMAVFGLDPTHDILKSVTGTSKETVSFRNITGGDAFFAFNSDTEFTDILDVSEQLIELYNKDDYKDNFSWVDNLRRLKDEAKIEELNASLLRNILAKDTTQTFLTLPEIISWDSVDGFSYTRQKDDIKPSLDIIDYYETIDVDRYNEDRIKGDRVFVHECDSDYTQFPISRCLYTEIVEEKNTYVRFMGDWFEVENNFLEEIDTELRQIKQSNFPFLPVYKWEETNGKGEVKIKVEKEGDYNKRVCENEGFYCLDAKNIKSKMMSSPIEICDILTPDKKLIHAKHRKGGSSSLSHLFSQGYVSAESLLSYRDLRIEARKKIRVENADVELIPINRLKANEYEVCYLILGYETDENIATRLPFFSKLNLYRVNKTLRQKGFNVSIAGCGYEEINRN